jgi:hypothetical protein
MEEDFRVEQAIMNREFVLHDWCIKLPKIVCELKTYLG